jgi:hypothetical protein
MDPVFKKLNYKEQPQVFALNAPPSFAAALQSLEGIAAVKTKVGKTDNIEFAIGFAVMQTQVDAIAETVAPKLSGDAVLWVCYPKGSSKRYRCDFNRDTGWDIMGKYKLEPVRQVAIDEDWSALRFRKIEFIKNFTRSETMALSEEGKARTKKKK